MKVRAIAILVLACGLLLLLLADRTPHSTYQRAVSACAARVSTIEEHLCLEAPDPDRVRPR